jgi:predicted Fe-Mo cluster-binding NifX family protein
MKIAIASESKELFSVVSSRGGRAKYYLIFENKKLVETIKNPFAVGGGGAGFSVIEMLYDKKIDIIIGGQFGSNMISAIKNKKIRYKEISEKKIEDIINDI